MFDNILSILMSIRITDVIDILIVAYLIYKVLSFIRETRAQQLVRGILLIVAFFVLSDLFNLNLLNWTLQSVITVGAFALVVIFQPELRRGLEQVGRKGFMPGSVMGLEKSEAIDIANELTDAVDDFSSSRTGALIVIERQTMLNDIIETGSEIDARIVSRLLGNIFYEGSPLHDGAVVIRGNRIAAASCVLPLSEKTNIGRNLGTRHRAGLGVSEVSDAFVIVVSEESGAISIAEDGKLRRFVDLKTLEKDLLTIFMPEQAGKPSLLGKIGIKSGGEKDA